MFVFLLNVCARFWVPLCMSVFMCVYMFEFVCCICISVRLYVVVFVFVGSYVCEIGGVFVRFCMLMQFVCICVFLRLCCLYVC